MKISRHGRELPTVVGAPGYLNWVGRNSVEPAFERCEANMVSVLRKPQHRDARGASGGNVGSTESRPTLRSMNAFSLLEIMVAVAEPTHLRVTLSGLQTAVDHPHPQRVEKRG